MVLVLFGSACKLDEGKEGYALGEKTTALMGRARRQERPATQFGRAAARTVAKKTLKSGKALQLDKNGINFIICGLLRSPPRLTKGPAMPHRVHLFLGRKFCWKTDGLGIRMMCVIPREESSVSSNRSRCTRSAGREAVPDRIHMSALLESSISGWLTLRAGGQPYPPDEYRTGTVLCQDLLRRPLSLLRTKSQAS